MWNLINAPETEIFGIAIALMVLLGVLEVISMLAGGISDWLDNLLPDSLTLPLLWGGLLLNLSSHGMAPLPDAVIGAMTGYLSLWSVYWLFKLLTGKEGMGYGDFKLLAALGVMVVGGALRTKQFEGVYAFQCSPTVHHRSNLSNLRKYVVGVAPHTLLVRCSYTGVYSVWHKKYLSVHFWVHIF